MMDDFLTDQEKNYILSKAELIRVSQRIAETASALEKALNGAQAGQVYKPQFPGEFQGESIKVTFVIDRK
jgi:hypothetical protein